jgi:Protein of unknown function (DUF4058)
MPSPFPGMDPYLEAPEHWHNVHHGLINAIAADLNTNLPEGFAAEIEEKVYVLYPDGYYPDVVVLRQETPAPIPIPNTTSASGNTILAPTPSLYVELRQEEIRLPVIHIVATTAPDVVVTAIEVLSPVNKRGEGNIQYAEKRDLLLQSDTHLLEIDLLRSGRHTVAVPAQELKSQADWDYLICLHRVKERGFQCWAFTVRNTLPVVQIPLTESRADFLLDMQKAFTRTYEEGPFRRRIRYNEPLTPPLQAKDRAWASALLLSQTG